MTDKIDAARINLLLGELRLPGIKLIWAALAQTAEAGPPPASWPRSANRRWWSAVGGAWNVISRRPGCPPERPSTHSTSMPYR